MYLVYFSLVYYLYFYFYDWDSSINIVILNVGLVEDLRWDWKE